ncbi:unnamed protein product [Urochloa decumbens]|uniref:F-box domain-containing protein n=1 Tax=Urochloa decumbens TaxID=240449 RepID=A0ABC9GXY5_9POAL
MPPSAGIDVLPDEVLHHILGFLEAHESVRTCVLARRWRHLWKSATGLHVLAGNGEFLGSLEKVCNFLDSLLRHRPSSPLHTCELRFTSFGHWVPDCLSLDEHRLLRLVNIWFWHATKDLSSVDSRHLTRLELYGIDVNRRFLDFSNCPLLEHLEFRNCRFDFDHRLCICAPSLVSLLLDDIWGFAPRLESMPSLVKAVVTTVDCCDSCSEANCHSKDLALISGPETYTFKKDLRWCPIFSELKILLLNEYWCLPDDFRALVCILEHSPVLEKLTLDFSEKHWQETERKGTLRAMEGSAAILEHLKIIEVRCNAVDERICKLTLFLCAFNIRLILN